MQFPTMLSLSLAILAPVNAWTVTNHVNDDCDPGPGGSYRWYEGSTTNVCHNFRGGGGSITCRQYTNGGDNVDSCPNTLSLSASVWIRYSTRCTFYTDPDCRGYSESAGGGQCLNGAWLSWRCVRILRLLLVWLCTDAINTIEHLADRLQPRHRTRPRMMTHGTETTRIQLHVRLNHSRYTSTLGRAEGLDYFLNR